MMRMIFRRRLLAVFILALSAMSIFFIGAGTTLGIFIAGLFTLAFVQPLNVKQPIATPIMAWLAIAMFWMIAPIRGVDAWAQYFELVILLLAFGLFVSLLAAILRRLDVQGDLANGVVMLLIIAWLTWPIWLRTSPGLTLKLLVKTQPILVANGVLANEEPWTERTLAYELTDLNQNVPIEYPGSAWPCIGLLVVCSVAMFAISRLGHGADKIHSA